MNMNTNINESVSDLAKMISEGKLLEAFDQYYDERVSMQENEAEPRVGKEANRKAEEVFVNGITKINKIEILGVAIGENFSVLEYHMDVEHKDYGRINKNQVAVQRWENNKIISEKFYYDPTAKLD